MDFSFNPKPKQTLHFYLEPFFYVLMWGASGSRKQSDLFFPLCTSLTHFHPHVDSMFLNMEQLKSLVKYDSAVASVHGGWAVRLG